jgi:hypothetical protein
MNVPYKKRVTRDKAHAVYTDGCWTWYILKMYQTVDQAKLNPYARALCLVVTPDDPTGKMADCYLRDILGHLVRGFDFRGCRPSQQERFPFEEMLR